MIWDQWRTRKIDTKIAERELIKCRDYSAEANIRKIRTLVMLEQELLYKESQRKYMLQLVQNEKPFVYNKELEDWAKSHDQQNLGKTCRWKTAVLLGETEEGKTKKAMSMFRGRTLKVSCNGLPFGILPCLREFDRDLHDCIVFDEIRPDQILGNRELFQAGVFPVKLSQSACSQHEYRIWCYGTALIGCTNSLSLPEKSPTLAEDQNWLSKNLLVVKLEKGKVWYVK